MKHSSSSNAPLSRSSLATSVKRFGCHQRPQEIAEIISERMNSSRTALAANVRHDSRVHLIAPLPSLIHTSGDETLPYSKEVTTLTGDFLTAFGIEVNSVHRCRVPSKPLIPSSTVSSTSTIITDHSALLPDKPQPPTSKRAEPMTPHCLIGAEPGQWRSSAPGTCSDGCRRRRSNKA